MNPVYHAKTPTALSIWQFIMLSVTTHIALLAAWHYPVPLPFAIPQDNVLSVTMTETTQAPVSSPIMHAVTDKKTAWVRQPAGETHVVHQSHPAESNNTAPESAKQSATVSSDKTEMTATTALAKIQSRLLTDLARHFYYPLLARQRGWEGTVLLGMRVESNGHLDHIRVEQSSGYAVLDHSALNSLSRVGRLAEASDWLAGRSMNMQLPVIYRLVEK
jgi:TonB family protein